MTEDQKISDMFKMRRGRPRIGTDIVSGEKSQTRKSTAGASTMTVAAKKSSTTGQEVSSRSPGKRSRNRKAANRNTSEAALSEAQVASIVSRIEQLEVATTATVNEGVERLVGLFNGATSSYSVESKAKLNEGVERIAGLCDDIVLKYSDRTAMMMQKAVRESTEQNSSQFRNDVKQPMNKSECSGHAVRALEYLQEHAPGLFDGRKTRTGIPLMTQAEVNDNEIYRAYNELSKEQDSFDRDKAQRIAHLTNGAESFVETIRELLSIENEMRAYVFDNLKVASHLAASEQLLKSYEDRENIEKERVLKLREYEAVHDLRISHNIRTALSTVYQLEIQKKDETIQELKEEFKKRTTLNIVHQLIMDDMISKLQDELKECKDCIACLEHMLDLAENGSDNEPDSPNSKPDSPNSESK